jgi:hypothetical protein
MGEDVNAKVAELEKKLAEQARFTRTVVVACTCAILGVQFYTTTETFSGIVAINNLMGSMQSLAAQRSCAQAQDKAQAPAK